MRLVAIPVLLAASILLVGCSSKVSGPSETPNPVASTAPSTPAPESTELSGPAQITESNLHDVCLAKVIEAGQLAPGDPSNVRIASESDEITLTRDDGFVGVYFVVDDGNNTYSQRTAVSCVAKGTLQEPHWYKYGAGSPFANEAEAIHSLRVVHQD
jgi:hypothetical protein